ncbi:hypothetical protein QZH41_003720 [Actinostola sp. cb2023]|nr:hypothetical protein QZH41_003720 [Actinostola sp. cb2023]
MVVKFNLDQTNQRKRKAPTTPASEVYVKTKKVVLDDRAIVERMGIKQEFSMPAEWFYRVEETGEFFRAPTMDVVMAYEYWQKNRHMIDCYLTPHERMRFLGSGKQEEECKEKETGERSVLSGSLPLSETAKIALHKLSENGNVGNKEGDKSSFFGFPPKCGKGLLEYPTGKGSQGRGKLWQKIAESLNPSTTRKFCVDDRGIRERYNLLKSKHKGKMSKEIKASGISPEESEYTKLITEVIDLEEASTASLETGKKVDMVLEREKAEDIRLKAMETLAETKKRKELKKDDEEEEDLEELIEKKPKRFRRNANETLSYLKTKNEIEKIDTWRGAMSAILTDRKNRHKCFAYSSEISPAAPCAIGIPARRTCFSFSLGLSCSLLVVEFGRDTLDRLRDVSQREEAQPQHGRSGSVLNHRTAAGEVSPSQYQGEVSPFQYQGEVSPFQYQGEFSPFQYQEYRQRVLQWISLAEQRLTEGADRLMEKRSILSTTSRSSRRSSKQSSNSGTSARERERLKLAEMIAEKSLLKKKLELQAAAEELKAAAEELRLETEIAKSRAREEVYATIDAEETRVYSQAPPS